MSGMPAASAISRMPASTPCGSRGSPQGRTMAVGKCVATEETGLIDGAPERRPEARDRPPRRVEAGQPVEQRFVLGKRDVVEERVAAVEEARDAAVGDMPGDLFGGVEVERTFGRRPCAAAAERRRRPRDPRSRRVSRVLRSREAFPGCGHDERQDEANWRDHKRIAQPADVCAEWLRYRLCSLRPRSSLSKAGRDPLDGLGSGLRGQNWLGRAARWSSCRALLFCGACDGRVRRVGRGRGLGQAYRVPVPSG